MAAEVVGGGHTLAALGLELPDDGHAVAAGDLQSLLTQRQEGARRLLGLLPGVLHPEDFKLLSAQLGGGHRPGNQSPDMVDDVPYRLTPVDGAHVLAEHGGVGGLVVLLGRPGRGTCLNGGNGVAGKSRGDDRNSLHELRAGLHGVDGRLSNFDDIALVHAGGEIHGRDAGLLTVVENGPLHRPRAAKLRKNAGVHVDGAFFRDIQHRLGQDLPVGHHHQKRGLERPELSKHRLVLEGLGLEHRKIMR